MGVTFSKRARSEDASDADEARPTKRQKVKGIASSPMDRLNDDCVLLIMQFLLTEDLNSIEICSHRCQQARGHGSLDQTARTGAIVCTEGSTWSSLYNKIIKNDWNTMFSGNRKKLKIVGFEELSCFKKLKFVGIERCAIPTKEQVERTRLNGVTILEVHFDSGGFDKSSQCSRDVFISLSHLFPNLKEVIDNDKSEFTSKGYDTPPYCT